MCKSCLGANERQGWLKPNIGYLCSSLPGVCDLAGGHSWGDEYVSSSDCERITYSQECSVCGTDTVRYEETGEKHDYSIKEYTANKDEPDCSSVKRQYLLKCSKCDESEGPYSEGGLGYHVYEQGPNGGLWRCIYCRKQSPGNTYICGTCGRDSTEEICPYCSGISSYVL